MSGLISKWELLTKKGDIRVTVTVKNTGKVTGRDVVQLYLNAPYTDYDRENHIEKSSVNLVGFEKTGDLAPGESETVTITANIADFKTYDDVNSKTYILEAGDYLLTAAKNAHLALNDQENHRSHVATFSNEQAIREIYLKPFQMCIEQSSTQNISVQRFDEPTGTYTKDTVEMPTQMTVMTAYNRIGCTWAGGNYHLITNVLRNEWGFNGSVITDYDNGGAMDTEQCIRAGGDLKLTAMGSDAEFNIEDPASQYFARQAMKHVLYTTANSNAMNGMIHGSKAPGKAFANYYFILIALCTINGVLCILIVTSIVRRWKNEKTLR